MKKRVLVIDRYELVAAGVSKALAMHDNIVVLPCVASFSVAMREIAARVPDVIVIDPFQPDSMDILLTLREKYPEPRLLVLTDNDNPEDIQLALQHGVDGYVLKCCSMRDLGNAIESVLQGEVFLLPKISHILLERRASEFSEFSLTRRQEEVLKMIAEGRTVKQIANSLGISAKTVESHRVTLMNRLGIHHVPGLVHFAIRHGYAQLSASMSQKA